MHQMNISIKNCNSIDEASVSLEPGRINIKYGSNGTGKSTIAKAISLSTKHPVDFSSLIPFKYRSNAAGNPNHPHIAGVEQFSSIATFNEDYINQFVFTQDEVIKNSFDIFIKNADYDAKMMEIETLVAEIKETFNKNEKINEVLKDLEDLSSSFGTSQSGYSKAGKIGKGIGNGNRLEHIPEDLIPYTSFIKSEVNIKWLKWQIEGNSFSHISTDCPYCTAPTEEKQKTIRSVSKEYDAKSLEHLITIQAIVTRLGKYFHDDVLLKLDPIIKNKDGLTREQITYLLGIKAQIDTLKEKLKDAKSVSFFSLRDVAQVQNNLSGLKIDLGLLEFLKSPETQSIADQINASLDVVLTKTGKLQGEVNKQKKGIERTIEKYKKEINTFLKYAGYKYAVDIQYDSNTYKMKLKHMDFNENIENGALHLSYGERNAFSIVLFMYECLTKNPDLVVLDDPISSFDKTKKFSILEMLFRGENSLRGRTVLMLTHDIEPIIDLVKNLSHTFEPIPKACFLKSKNGIITEISISKDDISTFAQICTENISQIDNDIIKCIYLRRYYEIVNDKGIEYHLLSNLLHKRSIPFLKHEGEQLIMTQEQIANSSNSIKSKLPSFNYSNYLTAITDTEKMIAAYNGAGNNYEKLQLFRIINSDNHHNDVIKKYINEAFHIENEYIMQLNPHKYDFIPEHIIYECNQAIIGIQEISESI